MRFKVLMATNIKMAVFWYILTDFSEEITATTISMPDD
jgi:hypothetical protein